MVYRNARFSGLKNRQLTLNLETDPNKCPLKHLVRKWLIFRAFKIGSKRGSFVGTWAVLKVPPMLGSGSLPMS